MSVFLLINLGFLLRHLSGGFLIEAGNPHEAVSLPSGRHSAVWVDQDMHGCLRLSKRKHRQRGSFTRRPCTCASTSIQFCLPCRFSIALGFVQHSGGLFHGFSSADALKQIRWASEMIGHQTIFPPGKAFRAGHATALAFQGASTRHILAAGEWRSRTFLKYIDEDTIDPAEFLNATLDNPDNELED